MSEKNKKAAEGPAAPVSAKLPNEPKTFTGMDLNLLLMHAWRLGASDITMQTGEEVYFEIHGRITRVTNRRLTASEIQSLISASFGSESAVARMSGGADLDFAYEIPLSRSDMAAEGTKESRIRFRVNATAIAVGAHTGFQITMRVINGRPPSVEELGIEPEVLEAFYPRQGLVLVTGATGSGKSTLLAACIRRLCEEPDGNRKILTYEHPIEYVYDEIEKPSTVVSQTEIGKHLPSFAAGVRNALRRKPMVILVGEARDAETIGECVTASMTGHLTYSTVHSNGVADTIRRMVNAFDEGEQNARANDIVDSLKMIVSQMLVRSTDGKRVALREYLVFDRKVGDMLLDGGLDRLTINARRALKEYGRSFLQDALAKHAEGRIDDATLESIRRVSDATDMDAGLAPKPGVPSPQRPAGPARHAPPSHRPPPVSFPS